MATIPPGPCAAPMCRPRASPVCGAAASRQVQLASLLLALLTTLCLLLGGAAAHKGGHAKHRPTSFAYLPFCKAGCNVRVTAAAARARSGRADIAASAIG
eukprot:jgi/Ulvmu1/11965/UM082_0044.1